VAPSWRGHYERLHLHTVKRYSALPMAPYPDEVPRYPSRDEVVAYLDAYARRFEIAPRFGETVRRIRPGEVESDKGTYRARAVVVCTGYNRVPNVPTWPGDFGGPILHSAAYRNGAPYRGQRVLVVGCGNSGAEIALDLWEHGAQPTLAIRGPVHVVPRDLGGVPAQITSLFVFAKLPPKVADRVALFALRRAVGDLSRFGIERPAIGPVSQVLEKKRVPLVDVGTIALIRQGKIAVAKDVASFAPREVRFVDGTARPFDAVVLATGYRTGLPDLVEGVDFDARGLPPRFGEAVAPGLYFVGFRNPPTGQLLDIAHEAERVAADIAGR
jgi:lysine/ornithine N-monooxygenase